MADNEYTRRMAGKHIGKEDFERMPADLQDKILTAIEYAYQQGYEDGANSENEDGLAV